jgi:uncharacterized OsmC-like protein
MSDKGYFREGESLAELQKPFKKKLSENPEKAFKTVSIDAVLSGLCKWKVSLPGVEYEAGLSVPAGGENGLASPSAVFLSSICSCAGVTLSAVAENMGINLRSAKAVVNASLDLRGTMGIAENVPVGFQNIELVFEVDSDADDKQLKVLLEMSKKYSVNLQTLNNKPLIKYDIKRQ